MKTFLALAGLVIVSGHGAMTFPKPRNALDGVLEVFQAWKYPCDATHRGINCTISFCVDGHNCESGHTNHKIKLQLLKNNITGISSQLRTNRPPTTQAKVHVPNQHTVGRSTSCLPAMAKHASGSTMAAQSVVLNVTERIITSGMETKNSCNDSHSNSKCSLCF